MRHTHPPIFARVVEQLEGGRLWSVCSLPLARMSRARNLARRHGRSFRLAGARALPLETTVP